ncbi:hypothetical protein ACFYT4_12720 [Streptomyces sp. NPDC004609]
MMSTRTAGSYHAAAPGRAAPRSLTELLNGMLGCTAEDREADG